MGDFGQLAVGQTKVMPLRVRNHGLQPAQLEAAGLNSTGPFTLLNALRVVPHSESMVILVQFAPIAQGVRQETLDLFASNVGRGVKVALRGEGVSSILDINPPHEDG